VSCEAIGLRLGAPGGSRLPEDGGLLATGMSGFFATIGALVGGWIGWSIGAHVGLMTGYMLSVVGSALGVYLGRQAADALLP
jgi:hypothetical protein